MLISTCGLLMMFIILFWLSSENLEPVSAAKTGRRFEAMPKKNHKKKRKKYFRPAFTLLQL